MKYLNDEQVKQVLAALKWAQADDKQCESPMYKAINAAIRTLEAAEVVPQDERAAFEAKFGGRFDMRWDSNNRSRYYVHATNWIWDAWKAGRAALSAPVAPEFKTVVVKDNRNSEGFGIVEVKLVPVAPEVRPIPGMPFADLATPIREFEARKAAEAALEVPQSELPPLPKEFTMLDPRCEGEEFAVFTADQMTAYAAVAVAQERAACAEELEGLCFGAENGGGGTLAERLRQAQRIIRNRTKGN